MWRAAATSGRFCSTARRSFFVRQPEVAQGLPDRAAMHRDPVGGRDLGGQRGGGQVPLLANPPRQPAFQRSKLAMPAAVALRLRRKTPGRGLQLDHVVDKADRYLEPCRRRTVRVPFRHKIHHPLAQLYRMRLAHH